MNVRDLMSWEVRACHADSDLGTAAMIMWDQDCGIVPIVDKGNRLIGVVTDRDVSIATATKNRAPSTIKIREILGKPPRTCRPDDEVRAAMETMAEARVRRLPVVDKSGELCGILSLNDIIRHTRTNGLRGAPDIGPLDVLRVLQAISRHRAEPALAGAT
ncbi:MAG: CBS domain-containing protein [Hyphomicrobiales bacterium]